MSDSGYTPSIEGSELFEAFEKHFTGCDGDADRAAVWAGLCAVEALVREDERKQIVKELQRLQVTGILNSTFKLNGMTYNTSHKMSLRTVIDEIERPRGQSFTGTESEQNG